MNASILPHLPMHMPHGALRTLRFPRPVLSLGQPDPSLKWTSSPTLHCLMLSRFRALTSLFNFETNCTVYASETVNRKPLIISWSKLVYSALSVRLISVSFLVILHVCVFWLRKFSVISKVALVNCNSRLFSFF